ncbi:TonB-dependent receptor domain-containing protein [Pseudomonas sp. N040]|uniref:TonB-dependent receptor domain-containing protein n=1 Tax=Pseudomonas sp. N040 TaxID=2785325 RepID=UPI0018A31AED|nr:TonB-dependent receptor [Pseudomonas sp. N040]MBF7730160.1 TonB-dependent receptor [Pseudomonas sp. N040]MBW7013802.1 TonB-dependent receptor [Pseudomonas sp. N040]
MKRLSLAAALALLPLAAPADSSSDPRDAMTAPALVITSGRQAEPRLTAVSATSVFTRADIERLQARNVPDLLARVPGVVTRNSGGLLSYSVRGTRSSQTLVLVDGQRIASAASGIARLDYLSIDNIERVEVSRGARSSLYGADAIGGVIQIFTRRGGQGLQPSVRLAAGSAQTWQRSASLSAGDARSQLSLGASLDESNGHDSTRDNLGADSDADGTRNQAQYLNLDHWFNADWQAGLSYNEQFGKNEYDDAYEQAPATPSDQFRVGSASSYLQGQLGEAWQSRLELGRSYDRNKAVDAASPWSNGLNATTRHSASWLNRLALAPEQQLTLGGDWYEDRLDSSTAYAEDSRSNQAALFQHRFSGEQLSSEIGLRHDDNQRYGSENSWNGMLGLPVSAEQQWLLSYSEGFRAPTFSDLYYPGAGNPQLQAETSQTWELQWRAALGDSQLETSLYRNDIDNMIVFSGMQPENVGQARINGFETALSRELFGWQASLGLSLLDPRNRDNGQTLQLTPRRSLSLDLDRRFGALAAGASWRAVSQSYDYSIIDASYASDRQSVPGYGLVDLRGSWQAASSLRFDLQLNNLLDKDYYTALYQRFDASYIQPPGAPLGYQEPGRTALLALTWTP